MRWIQLGQAKPHLAARWQAPKAKFTCPPIFWVTWVKTTEDVFLSTCFIIACAFVIGIDAELGGSIVRVHGVKADATLLRTASYTLYTVRIHKLHTYF